MTETERQGIILQAKDFFRTKVAEKHTANTKKLSAPGEFNINPFTHKYLARFAFGDASPESMAKVLLYPRVFGDFDFHDIWHPAAILLQRSPLILCIYHFGR